MSMPSSNRHRTPRRTARPTFRTPSSGGREKKASNPSRRRNSGRRDAATTGPYVEASIRISARDRPFVEASLQQHVERFADNGTGRDAQELHDLATVERRLDGRQFLFLSQRLDACFEIVHATGQRAGFVA